MHIKKKKKLSEQWLAHGRGQESCFSSPGSFLFLVFMGDTHWFESHFSVVWFKHWVLCPTAAVLFGEERAGHGRHSQGSWIPDQGQGNGLAAPAHQGCLSQHPHV